MCLTYYPVTFFDGVGRPFRKKRAVVTPGVAAARDGMVAVGVGTGQHWLDFCVMVDHPEWMEDRSLFRERGHLAPVIDEWFAGHTVGEIRDLATAFRLPNALIANGANLPSLDHFEARRSFIAQYPRRVPPARRRPTGCTRPGSGVTEPAPRLGEHTGDLPSSDLRARARRFARRRASPASSRSAICASST